MTAADIIRIKDLLPTAIEVVSETRPRVTAAKLEGL